MSPLVVLTVLGVAGLGVSELPLQEDGIHGVLPAQTTWSGEVVLRGDVTVPAGGRLEVLPGTRVVIAKSNTPAGGWNTRLVELHVKGQLLVLGNVDAPVTFEPADDLHGKPGNKEVNSWHGIVLHPREEEEERFARHVFRGAAVHRAVAGLQVPNGDVLVEDCVFHACGVGMEVGFASKSPTEMGIWGDRAAPEIRRCRFVLCHSGVSAQLAARVSLERCVFVKCRTGVGPDRPGYTYHLRQPGSDVQHCAFVDTTTAVLGCASVRGSWFLRCRYASKLTDFHDRLATDTEQLVFDDNLVHAVKDIVAGDTALARRAYRGPIELSGPVEDLLAHWPPLPACLLLPAGPVEEGATRERRDLGPLARPSILVAELGWASTTSVSLPWLVAPGTPPRNWYQPGALRPGAKVGERWWALADSVGTEVFDLRNLFGRDETGGLVALEFDAPAAGSARLNWTGDLTSFGLAFDGKIIFESDRRSRFGAVEEPLELRYAKGRHRLALRIVGVGREPRFALSLPPDWRAQPASVSRDVKVDVRAVRGRGGVTLEAKLTQPVHWAATPGVALATYRIGSKEVEAVATAWHSPSMLLIGPIPDLPAGEVLSLQLPGLRDLAGVPLELEPIVVRVR